MKHRRPPAQGGELFRIGPGSDRKPEQPNNWKRHRETGPRGVASLGVNKEGIWTILRNGGGKLGQESPQIKKRRRLRKPNRKPPKKPGYRLKRMPGK
jgi:hypothetical protein